MRRSNMLLTEKLRNKSLENEMQQSLLSHFQSIMQPRESQDAKKEEESKIKNESENSPYRDLSWQNIFYNLSRQFVESFIPDKKLDSLAEATTSFLNQSFTGLNKFYESIENASFFDGFESLNEKYGSFNMKKCQTIRKKHQITALLAVENVNDKDDDQENVCQNMNTIEYFAELGKQLIDHLQKEPSEGILNNFDKMTVEFWNESVSKFTLVVEGLQKTMHDFMENTTKFANDIETEFQNFWFIDEDENIHGKGDHKFFFKKRKVAYIKSLENVVVALFFLYFPGFFWPVQKSF